MTGQRARFLPSGQLLHVVGGAALVALTCLAVHPLPAAASTTFVVNRIGDAADNNLADSKCDTSSSSGNQCTLRAAIQESNDTSGADTINFNITSTSKTIAPTSALPQITGRVTINGYTQTGASTNTKQVGNDAVLKIVLDGVNAGAGSTGLDVRANSTTIRGLVIQRFDGPGVLLAATGGIVRGNLIGTNAAGDVARPNCFGVMVTGAANVIGGDTASARNLISGNDCSAANDGDGIQIVGASASGTSVLGNYIGTTKNGLAALENGSDGVDLNGTTGVTVGGTTAGARNVISGNNRQGVQVHDSTGCSILGNYLGTDAAGTAGLRNGDSGVEVVQSDHIDIGNSTAGSGNIISANNEGIELLGADNIAIRRNKIGTKADGTGDLGNKFGGIHVQGSNNVIGGPNGQGNTIANTDFQGIFVSSDATGNTIQGNAIVANAEEGIEVYASNQQILGNVIISNGQDGVLVVNTTPCASNGILISGNQIFANGELGINLESNNEDAFGVSPNDSFDGTSNCGANRLQNYPVLTSAVRQSNGVTVVSGSLNSKASSQFMVELFFAAADPSGHGEAQAMLATQTITTNSAGNKSFSFAVGGLAPGLQLTATATNTSTNDTSEFSSNVVVIPGP
jgi:hypothetical protein